MPVFLGEHVQPAFLRAGNTRLADSIYSLSLRPEKPDLKRTKPLSRPQQAHDLVEIREQGHVFPTVFAGKLLEFPGARMSNVDLPFYLSVCHSEQVLCLIGTRSRLFLLFQQETTLFLRELQLILNY
ncbi:MAG TPA: hypothetical protein VG167_06035 [Verrucomicrobiae bacterium]|nr:hypothetical protein [Verrucomicrobiae bacterium]